MFHNCSGFHRRIQGCRNPSIGVQTSAEIDLSEDEALEVCERTKQQLNIELNKPFVIPNFELSDTDEDGVED